MHFFRAVYSDQLKSNGCRINPGLIRVPITNPEMADIGTGINIIFPDPEGYPYKLMIYPEKPTEISFFEDHSGEPVNLNQDSGFYLYPQKSEPNFSKMKCLVRYNGDHL